MNLIRTIIVYSSKSFYNDNHGKDNALYLIIYSPQIANNNLMFALGSILFGILAPSIHQDINIHWRYFRCSSSIRERVLLLCPWVHFRRELTRRRNAYQIINKCIVNSYKCKLIHRCKIVYQALYNEFVTQSKLCKATRLLSR